MDIKEINLENEFFLDKDPSSSFVNLDFKVVSFELSDKNYLIDIMEVKEIRKSSEFTYVPNTRKYVKGLDNLRGEIIPIIDLRIMFNLYVAEKSLEDVLVVKHEGSLVGVIVDKINNVFSISSSFIQEPHPVLVADSVIDYIKGVVELNKKLFILLDINKIFNYNEDEKSKKLMSSEKLLDEVELDSISFSFDNSSLEQVSEKSNEELDLGAENLNNLSSLEKLKKDLFSYSFNTSLINDDFLTKFMKEMDFSSIDDAIYEKFLSKFYSKSSSGLWSKIHLDEFKNKIILEHLNNFNSGLKIFEVGCSNGKGTMSLVSILHECYNDPYKVIAIDNDLLKVISTSKLTLTEDEINLDEIYKKYTFEQSLGTYKFNPELFKNILFEYSDALLSEFPENLGLVLLKDVLCFLNDKSQSLLLENVNSKTLKGAILILGDNEELKNSNIFLKDDSIKHFNVYKKV